MKGAGPPVVVAAALAACASTSISPPLPRGHRGVYLYAPQVTVSRTLAAQCERVGVIHNVFNTESPVAPYDPAALHVAVLRAGGNVAQPRRMGTHIHHNVTPIVSATVWSCAGGDIEAFENELEPAVEVPPH